MGNFSRYVRPGDQRHDVTGAPRDLHILAFATAPVGAPAAAPVQIPSAGTGTGRGWSVVIINNARAGSDATAFTLQLPMTGSARLVASVAVETSASRDLEPVELPSVSTSGMLSARVPAQSVTTYVLRSGTAR